MSAIFDTIRNFFHYIADTISSIVGLFSRVLSLLGSVFTYVKNVFQLFPSWLYIVIVVLLAVCIIYKVLGREGNA